VIRAFYVRPLSLSWRVQSHSCRAESGGSGGLAQADATMSLLASTVRIQAVPERANICEYCVSGGGLAGVSCPALGLRSGAVLAVGEQREVLREVGRAAVAEFSVHDAVLDAADGRDEAVGGRVHDLGGGGGGVVVEFVDDDAVARRAGAGHGPRAGCGLGG